MKNSATKQEVWIHDIEIIDFKQKMYKQTAWITLNGCNEKLKRHFKRLVVFQEENSDDINTSFAEGFL